MRSARGRARPCPQPGSVRCWRASPQHLQRCTSTPSSPPPRRRKCRDSDGRSHRARRPLVAERVPEAGRHVGTLKRDPRPPRHRPSSGSSFVVVGVRRQREPHVAVGPPSARAVDFGPMALAKIGGHPTARVPDRPVHRRHRHPPKSGEVRQPDRRAADAGRQRSVRPGHSRAGDPRPRPRGRGAHHSQHRGSRAISPPRPWRTSAGS